MTARELIDVKDLAQEWQVSPTALQRAADNAGLLVKIGRKSSIYAVDRERLIRSCQGQAKARASTGESPQRQDPANGLSSTVKQSGKQAQQIAEKLTKRLPITSTQGASTVTPIRPKHS